MVHLGVGIVKTDILYILVHTQDLPNSQNKAKFEVVKHQYYIYRNKLRLMNLSDFRSIQSYTQKVR